MAFPRGAAILPEGRAVELSELDQDGRDVAQPAAVAWMLGEVHGGALAGGELQVSGGAGPSFGHGVAHVAAGVEAQAVASKIAVEDVLLGDDLEALGRLVGGSRASQRP